MNRITFYAPLPFEPVQSVHWLRAFVILKPADPIQQPAAVSGAVLTSFCHYKQKIYVTLTNNDYERV
jgi:hypothetical protein